VDEWRSHLDKDDAECLLEIHEDEQNALQEVDLMEAKAEKVAADLEVQSTSLAVAVAVSATKMETMPELPENTMQVNTSVEGDVGNSDAAVPNVPQAEAVVKLAQVAHTATSLHTVGDDHTSALATVPDIIQASVLVEQAQNADNMVSLTTAGDHTSALDTSGDDSGPPVEPPASTTNEPSSSIINSGGTTLPSPVPTKVEACPTTEDQRSIHSYTHFVHADVDSTRVGRKRSGSSNSGSSESDLDFVKI